MTQPDNESQENLRRRPASRRGIIAVVLAIVVVCGLVLFFVWPGRDPWLTYNALPNAAGKDSATSWKLPDVLQIDIENNKVRFAKPQLSGTTFPTPNQSSDSLTWKFKAAGEIVPGTTAEIEGTLTATGGALSEMGNISVEALIRVQGQGSNATSRTYGRKK